MINPFFSSKITLPFPTVRFSPSQDGLSQLRSMSLEHRPNGGCLLVILEAGLTNKTDLIELVIGYTKVRTFLLIVVGKDERAKIDPASWSTYINLYLLGGGTRADYVCAGQETVGRLHFEHGASILKGKGSNRINLCPDALTKREIVLAFNDFGFEFSASTGKIDKSTHEGQLFSIYAEKYNLQIKLIGFYHNWNVYNYTSETYIGIPGLASLKFS